MTRLPTRSLCQFDKRRQQPPCSSPKAARNNSADWMHREAGMKKTLLATIIAVTAACGPSQAQQAITKDQLVGSWKVLNLKATTGDKVAYPLGARVTGYVTITPTRFWLLFV